MKQIRQARSKLNGIVFYSNIFPVIGLEAYYDDAGKIQTRLTFTPVDEIDQCFEEGNASRRAKRSVIVFDIFLIISSIIISIFTKNFTFTISSILFSIFASRNLLDLMEFSYKKKIKNGYEYWILKFHAAEHMAVNAYEKQQKVPTMEEVRKASRFSIKCGSQGILFKTFWFLILAIAIPLLSYFDIITYMIGIAIISIILNVADNNGWLVFLQVFTTKKTTDKELALAVEGLKQFEIMEELLIKEDEMTLLRQYPNDFPICIFKEI